MVLERVVVVRVVQVVGVERVDELGRISSPAFAGLTYGSLCIFLMRISECMFLIAEQLLLFKLSFVGFY